MVILVKEWAFVVRPFFVIMPGPVPRAKTPDSEAAITARTELAACFQLAALHGLEEGICNHFSAMVPGRDDLFFVNSYGYAFEEVTADNLLVRFSGQRRGGRRLQRSGARRV